MLHEGVDQSKWSLAVCSIAEWLGERWSLVVPRGDPLGFFVTAMMRPVGEQHRNSNGGVGARVFSHPE